MSERIRRRGQSLAEGGRRADRRDVAPKRKPDGYSFPDPPVLFMFAAFDFAIGVFALFKSVFAGVTVILIAGFFAVGGLLKKRRIIP